MGRNSITSITLALSLSACSGSGSDATPQYVAEAGVVDSGTKVGAALQSAFSSRTDSAGASLRAITSHDVKDGVGGVAIPAGSDVSLIIERLRAATTTTSPDGELSLRVGSITVNGRAHALSAVMAAVPHHLEHRVAAGASAPASPESAYRDVVVSAGTPIVFTLAQSMKVTAR